MQSTIYRPSEIVKNYFHILSPRFPSWLNEYINTPPLLFQSHISVTCGMVYTNLFDIQTFYSNLDHSVATALIVWHFTKDKKQTLAALFHDISTPTFKHCVDIMDGDYQSQESTEGKTSDIIRKSPEIMRLLKRDNIKPEGVDDYRLYPIADNDTPKLSADRLEYSLSNALFSYNLLDINEVRELYNDLSIQKNSDNEIELGFKNEECAVKFVKITSVLSIIYREDRTRYSMQFIADILKGLSREGRFTREDFYSLKESEVIDIIKNSKYANCFTNWQKAEHINASTTKPDGVYSAYCSMKVRYIDPLFNGVRISEQNRNAKEDIDRNLAFNMNRYVYLDFDFPE